MSGWLEWSVLRAMDLALGLLLGAGAVAQLLWHGWAVPALVRQGVILVLQLTVFVLTR